MSSAIDELLRNAASYEARFPGQRATIPARHVAIVTCMDSRINLFAVFGLKTGEAHILRNAGGLATEDMLRSLVLSQRLLMTREILLMQHTRCGLHGADEAALRRKIVAETREEPPYEFGAFEDIDRSVRETVATVRAHRFLPHRDRVR
ncbi:MAG TPA: carbonic anhydrase, partial [Candidatus Limnocylindrales bacterium]|nr:carbonic anhydrase [Candidatus Limnocylindrales bacterium]